MSMLGQRTFAWIDRRLRQATAQAQLPLGGMSVILFGDFAQLPPVGDRPLYSNNPSNDLALHGYTIYQLFTTVLMLNEVFRQQGSNPASQQFREILLHLRDGKIIQSDWEKLLQRSPNAVPMQSVIFITLMMLFDFFMIKKSVASYNYHKLQTLSTPIARIDAIHSNQAAAVAKSDDAGGLYPALFLAEGARVMLTANIWQEVGLCNGAAGSIKQFFYKEESCPPHLPIAVLVHFDKYSGPPFLLDQPSCIPIPPLTFEWESNGQQLSRQQLPLILNYNT